MYKAYSGTEQLSVPLFFYHGNRNRGTVSNAKVAAAHLI